MIDEIDEHSKTNEGGCLRSKRSRISAPRALTSTTGRCDGAAQGDERVLEDASGWVFNSAAKAAGLATPTVALLTLPFALGWIGLSLFLGREQETRAAKQDVAGSKGDLHRQGP